MLESKRRFKKTLFFCAKRVIFSETDYFRELYTGGNPFLWHKEKMFSPVPPFPKESTLLSAFRIKCHSIFTLPYFVSIFSLYFSTKCLILFKTVSDL